MTFQEKSLWVVLLGLLSAFGLYFGAVLPSHGVDIRPGEVVQFGLAVGLLVVVQVVGHASIAVMDRRVETDERDRLIALKGSRNGSIVLATGVGLSLFAAVATPGNFAFAHVLLAFWVLAQVVEVGSQLYLYRRGA